MVLFNHSTRELTAKIVYYGPGLCGKTTNLKVLHERLEKRTVGRLLSLATSQDRTIYFDLLPVELGNIKGYTVRFQLCTVPGQVFYNETRKLVLRGVDGIVFVVDSQWSMLSHAHESFLNLKENLRELDLSLETVPLVIQYNKRDLPAILSLDALQEALSFQRYPHVEAVAADGKGVMETYKLISKLTFVDLLRRLQRGGGSAEADAASALLASAGEHPAFAGEIHAEHPQADSGAHRPEADPHKPRSGDLRIPSPTAKVSPQVASSRETWSSLVTEDDVFGETVPPRKPGPPPLQASPPGAETAEPAGSTEPAEAFGTAEPAEPEEPSAPAVDESAEAAPEPSAPAEPEHPSESESELAPVVESGSGDGDVFDLSFPSALRSAELTFPPAPRREDAAPPAQSVAEPKVETSPALADAVVETPSETEPVSATAGLAARVAVLEEATAPLRAGLEELSGAVDDLATRLLETGERITITSAPVHREVIDLRVRTGDALAKAESVELGLRGLEEALAELRKAQAADAESAASRRSESAAEAASGAERLAAVEARIRSLSGRLEALDEAHRGGTIARLASLAQRVDGLRLADPEELTRVGALAQSLSAARASAERRLDEQGDSLAELRRTLEDEVSARSQLEARLQALGAAVEGQQKGLEEQAAGLGSAASGLSALQESLAGLSSQVQALAERPGLSGELAALGERLERLASQIGAAEQAAATVRETAFAEAAAERTKRDEEVRILRDSISELRQEVETARRDSAAATMNAASSDAAALAEIARLREELAGARALSASQAASAREALSALREEMTREVARALEAARAPLEDRVAAAEKRTKGLAEVLRRALDEMG